MWSYEALRDGDTVWLLTVTLGGVELRWSTWPLTIDTEDGDTVYFGGGLDADELEEAVTGLSDTPDLLSLPFEVEAPPGVDVAELIAAGHDFGAAPAEVALHLVGQTWERREVRLSGYLSQPEYGAADETLAFSVEELPYEDAALYPEATARITEAIWPSAPDDSLGLVYPFVFGSPGPYTSATDVARVTSGSPALIVEIDGSDNAQKLLVAGHRVEAENIRIYDESGSTFEDFPISHEQDGLGRVVAVVDVSGASSISLSDTEFWCVWNDGPAMDVGRAGDLLKYMLRLSTLRVDLSRVDAVKERLSAFRLAGYLDTEVAPWKWLQDNVLPLLPVTIRSGPAGLYPIVWRLDAVRAEAVAHIEAGAGVSREGRVSYTRRSSELVTELRLEFALRAKTGDYKRRLVLTDDPDAAEPEERKQPLSVRARLRQPRRSQTMTSDIVYDEVTAGRIGGWWLRLHSRILRQVVYKVPRDEQGWLRAGAVVTLTDDELHLSEAVCLVERIVWDGPDTRLSLLIL